MRILLIMDPGISVPPKLYGGHERLVYIFAEEYTRLGHSVTLLAGPESYCSGVTHTFGLNDLKRSLSQKNIELVHVWNYLRKNVNTFDLVHNFGRLLYLIPILNHPVYKIMSYGREVTAKGIKIANLLPNKNFILTACSNFCAKAGDLPGQWKTIYNAVDFSKYTLRNNLPKDAPLIFLGRFDPMKGAHEAITVALASNNKLIIAANKPTLTDDIAYFNEKVLPYIDGKQIIYLGGLNDSQKNDWLGKSKALLFPINGPEAFGLVMVEAMACGTPVIGFSIASVPEVIDEGITGFIVDDKNEMIKALVKIGQIDRECCRKKAESRFDLKIIAKEYLSIFDDV